MPWRFNFRYSVVAAELQLNSRLRHVPVISLNDSKQRLALGKFEQRQRTTWSGRRRGAGSDLRGRFNLKLPYFTRQVVYANDPILTDGQRGANRVAQFAEVAWPVVRDQLLQGTQLNSG